MSSWRVRQSYGYGAAHAQLAPVFVPGPFSMRESLATSLAAVAEELAALERGVLVRRSAAAFGLSLTLVLALLRLVPPAQGRDAPTQDLVLILPEPAQPEPLVPEPEPEPLLEEPLAPPPPAEAKPVAALPVAVEPAPLPPPARPEPPRVEPATQPAPRLRIDAIASAPQPAPPPPEHVERAPAPPRQSPTLHIDPVAPSFPVAAATAATPATSTPLRSTARSPVRAAPPLAFSLEPVAAAPAAPPAAPTAGRAAPRTAPTRLATAPMPRFEAVAPPARYADVADHAPPPAPARVTRTAAHEQGAAPVPSHSFQGVPLGSLAACVSDREEDSLKLSVMAAAGSRSSCSSRAGSYRFVETKNLNAFLMWIERDPQRKAADRCIELRLALECLAGTPNRRTDHG